MAVGSPRELSMTFQHTPTCALKGEHLILLFGKVDETASPVRWELMLKQLYLTLRPRTSSIEINEFNNVTSS